MSTIPTSSPFLREHPVKWYRSSFYNATILGLCNFAAPGIWGAMNSLGAGGAQRPYLVNTANALTFCLMVVSCYFSSAIVHYIGIKNSLVVGTLGYAPYAAGLYVNNRYGNEWLVLLGAALCGLSAGIFWMSEAAIAIAYPEPYNRGKLLGYWLSFRIGGQIIGGAVNLGLNADNNQAGKVSYTVFLVFIALQCSGPLVALLLNKPNRVQRSDGKRVNLTITDGPWTEIRRTTHLFFSPGFLLIVLFIGQAVYAEAVFFTYLSLWFTVRARALGSLVSALAAMVAGNILGAFLDQKRINLRMRSRASFITVATLQGAWWIWATILVTRFRHTRPTYDWVSPGFGSAFGVFVLLTAGFQMNYLLLYFIVGQMARDEQEVVRYAALLRGTESAWQAVSYGLNAIVVFAEVGGVYVNFGLWAVSLVPCWFVLRKFGSTAQDLENYRDGHSDATDGSVTPVEPHKETVKYDGR
ncbi:hypothetical protein EJ05DRAFT_532400 [Pseudovirgaria hyperparasitica]|uniref:MFS general substrate transporter n=1 Tax=Pseudovirgaria hyperparasitica TaxID=470096 RepID=A0A6A6W1H6_9PEZI|nr:uncharacterized protein EJ05DRAFT_532400 [Pseudovirgaria hyperparasitica]KAF2756385.1 hypothetical protein EJ05DRAFT_532400 [Pseudovirgaria hyperparasitica]